MARPQGLGEDSIDDITSESAYVFSNNLALAGVQMGALPVYLCLASLPMYCEEKLVALHEV